MALKATTATKPSEFVAPLLLMLHGGRYIEDVREEINGEAFAANHGPVGSAIGDWLRFIADANGGLSGSLCVIAQSFKGGLNEPAKKEFTLDIDATQIVADKQTAKVTTKESMVTCQ
ncbi:hypothetical protein MASR1M12_18560 [Erysipelotrichia bacterium]